MRERQLSGAKLRNTQFCHLMRHTLKQRVLMTLAATVVAGAFGASGGYLVGRALTLRIAEARLMRDANLVVSQGDSFSDEARAVLSSLKSSPYAFCSDEEISHFRRLIFQSKYLRDAGRIREGTIGCSTTISRADLPQVQYKADVSQPDGTRIYFNLPVFRVGNLPGILLQQGDSYVVFAPHLLENPDGMTSHLRITATGVFGSQNASSQGTAKIFTTDGPARLDGNLYYTKCSARYFRCASAYIPVQEAISSDSVHTILGVSLGGLTGAVFALLFCLLYRRNRSIEHQLRRAVAKDKLRLVYQPIVDLASKRIVGAEALARWTDEEGFAVSPDVFICVAEESGFVGSITRLVAHKALHDFAGLLKKHPDFRLSINVAAADLSDPGFLPMLEQALEEVQVPARSLAIEITETSTARHQAAREAISRLRQRGHSVHVDDFGTGYSSLSYLHDLSVDTIKIDRSFTQAIGTQAVTTGILPQILAMAAVLKLKVIVEGVETSQQASYFAEADESILAQGWLFGRPVPVEAFQSLLAEDEEKTEIPVGAAAGVGSEDESRPTLFFESSHNSLKISNPSSI